MRIVFFGTPEIAQGCLEELLDGGYNVVCVVTRADKPKGRGYKTEYSPVKKLALERGIETFQPVSLRNEEARVRLSENSADIFITCAYGRIFPSEILAIPPMGCVNVHASLLPAYRGASPINRTIMNGEKTGGVTIMYMDEGIDTGDMILKRSMEIPDDMDFGGYYEALTDLGRKALREFFVLAEKGIINREKQDDTAATYAPKVEKEETPLDFSDTAEHIYNKIRGLCPVPCAHMMLAGKRCKIYKAVRGKLCDNIIPGTILKADKNGIEIACGDNSIIITELQPDGKAKMTAAAFTAGNKVL
ncbi:MAG: methionyl-tRNA formyltransferase [Eubacteriales bacterium]|nr:methionyl-tRNA formyltransferase [Eubacteriales bacterium]